MNSLPKCFLMLLFGALLLSVVGAQTATAAPAFSVPDQPKFNYPLPDNTLNEVSFLVFSTEGEITGSSVQVRDVRTADGALLPQAAVNAQLENSTVTLRGERVKLTLDPRYFTFLGEYRITVFFQGPNGSPALSTTVVINRLGADINLDELKDQTVALTRPLPFWPASSNFTFYLREGTRRVTLNDLKVVGQGVFLKDTKELVPGAVAAAPLSTDPSGGPVNVPPGGVQPLQVSLWNLTRAGTFDTRLLVTSPSFTGEKVIPIKVTVRDFVLFPLVAIALGVVGGYLTRRLVAVERPRNQNTFQLLRLQNEVERFRDLVSKPASIDTINTLLAQLKRTRESNETSDFAAVKAELPRIQEKLDEFRKAQLQAGEAANTARNGLVNQVEVLENDALTADESRDLHSIKDRLTDAERLLRRGMVDDAEVKLENVKQLLADFRVRKLTNYFTLVTTEFDKLSLTGDAATTGATFKTEIRALLKSNEIDKAREKLEEFKNFVEKTKLESRPPGGREREDEFEEVLPAAPRVLTSAAVVTRIVITTPIEERIAGTTINFTIEDPEHLINSDDQLRWFFGDIGSSLSQGPSNTHRYDESGRFQVRVEILKNGIPAKTLSEFITIAQSAIEQARASVLQDILRNEKILSIIALVLATISGLLFLYVGKVFGSLVDYLTAILWGFGIDNSVKGFAAVLARISAPEG